MIADQAESSVTFRRGTLSPSLVEGHAGASNRANRY
jgi:hypothetical protein